MRVLILSTLLGLAVASFLNTAPDQTIAVKQQKINQLLDKVYEKLRTPDLLEAAVTFNPEGDPSLYKDNGNAVHCLLKELNEHRVLQHKHWFSLFNTRQRDEALMLFDVLMNCKSWNCFITNAAYFRERMNEGQFVYALYVAVIHSDLTRGLVLPPLYEITPHMFTTSSVISQAYTAKMTQTPQTLDMYFTGNKRNIEQRVAYFGEDIGMNMHHVAWHMNFPFWWQDSYGHHIDRKGELFFWVHHQLLSRFNAERLSNWLTVVDELYWDDVITEGFAPHTSYKYSGEFPSRPDNIRFSDVDGVARIQDMRILDSRIRDSIAQGYVWDSAGGKINITNEKGIDVLGAIIESSIYSPNVQFYGSLHNTAHVLLGRQGDPMNKYDFPPSVMEHFETATRDPSFFRIHKYIDNIFKEHKNKLTPYTQAELLFPGVGIEEVTIRGELRTYFDQFEFSLANAVDHSKSVPDIPIHTRVRRMNHRDFSYNILVNNNNGNEVLGTFRIFLCPRYDRFGFEYTWDEGRSHCIEMDKFWKKLTTGRNQVVRSSSESAVTAPDLLSWETLIQRTNQAVESGTTLNLAGGMTSACGIPNRLLLPKGRPQGMEFMLMVMVTNGEEDLAFGNVEDALLAGAHAHCGVQGELYPDKRSMGYPLDRRIPDDRIFHQVPNLIHTYVMLYHDDTQQ